jgi:ZIP family zinc transporter
MQVFYKDKAQPRSLLSSWPYGVALLVLLGLTVMLLTQAFSHAGSRHDNMTGALTGGLTAAAATALGTLPVLFSQKFSQRTYDCFLGFGGGVMLAATAFSLIVPALASARQQGAGAMGASVSVGGGILIGMAVVLLLDRVVRQTDMLEGIDPDALNSFNSITRAWLFVLAVALHNIPEGLAIGVAYAGIDIDKANTLATGISIQDVPEGLVVALALRGVGYGRIYSVALGVASGLVEPLASVFGAAMIGISATLLPWGLSAAAGAMLFVISHDVIPESHRGGNGTFASCSLVLGFVLMTVLDTALA